MAMKTKWLALSVASLIACSASPARAHSYIMMTDDELLSESQGVITAIIDQRLPARDGDTETRYSLSVFDALSGAKGFSNAVMAIPGTFDAPDINMVVPGMPKFEPGQEVLLFYSKRADGVLQPQQLTIGLFVRAESNRGDVYVRALEHSNNLTKSDDRQKYHLPHDAKRFEQWIQNRAKGITQATDYLLDGDVKVVKPKFTFSTFGSAGLQDLPGRWFQFDTDQSLQWQARSDGQVGANDSTGALTGALASWTNDATSRITMGYGGTAEAPMSCQVFQNGTSSAGCFSGHVKWNDPDSQIGGTFTGAGTLAFGGSSASNSIISTFNNSQWYQRLLAFVVVQDGTVGTVMNGNANKDGIELMTHEVGHAIGFGHSCEFNNNACTNGSAQDEAVMRSAIHRDGRGGTLGTDDIAGAAVIYPAPAPVNVGPTLTANSPTSGSSTAVAVSGATGSVKSINITFTVSGGSGTGTTALACTASGGNLAITSGTPQTISVGGNANPVVAGFTLTAAAQSGTVSCTATPQGGTVANFSYTLTAPAGDKVCGAGQSCVFFNGFE